MNKEDFQIMLKKHDWWYHMSEDPRVYEDGKASLNKILKICEQDSELNNMYKEYKENIYKNV